MAVFAQARRDSGPKNTELEQIDLPIRYEPITASSINGLLQSTIFSIGELKRYVQNDVSRYTLLNLAQAGKALKFVHKHDMEIDLIHSHFASRAQYPGLFLSYKFDVPWTVTTHAYDLFDPPNQYYRNKILEHADHIITISNYNRQYIRSELNSSTPIDVIRAGVDPRKFKSENETVTNRVVTVASAAEKKGYKTALRAIDEVSKGISGLEYRIIGWESEEQPELMALIHKLGIDEVVEVLGKISDEELLAEVDQAEIFLLPSQISESGDRDGIPVALMEAMALETPPVSTNVSGIPELVCHKETGFLAENANSESISKWVRYALENNLSSIKENGRNKVISDFNIRNEVQNLEDVFKEKISAQDRAAK